MSVDQQIQTCDKREEFAQPSLRAMLDAMKAELADPATLPERIARGQEALRNAKFAYQLDLETVRYIAESHDLDCF